AQITECMQEFFLNFCRVMNIMYRQTTHKSLYGYCTKSQDRFHKTAYLVIYHLHLIQPQRNHTSAKQALLGYLYQALVSNNIYTIMPANPGRQHDKKCQHKTQRQTNIKRTD